MDHLLSQEETAEVLNISLRQLNRLCRSKVLNAVYPEGCNLRAPKSFKESDVMAYLEVKDKAIDVPTLATISRQAYVTSKATERKLEQVMQFLGLNLPQLSLKRQDVMRLYVKVEDELDVVHRDIKPENILEWARIFYAVGEEYLFLIEEVVEDPEPWRKMLELANTLYKNAPREKFNADKRLASAYGFLDAGRKNLRSVAYFYIRNNHGPRAAELIFPAHMGDRDERIINMAFPDQH